MSMWNSSHGAPMYPGPYNQMGFHQSYERLQPGLEQQYYANDPRSPQHATQSFTARFYDQQFGGEEAFPKPVALLGRQNPHANNESFQSVALQSNTSSFVTTGFDSFKSEHQKKQLLPKKEKVPFSMYVQYFRDHIFRFVLWTGVAMVGICSLYLFGCVCRTCMMSAFSTFSSLAWESYFPSFYAIMILCACLAVGAFIIAVLGVIAGLKEAKGLLRSFITFSATLSFIILVLALFSWLYGLRAKPYVIRAANLMCQETDVWRCDEKAAARRLVSSSSGFESMFLSARRLQAAATGPSVGYTAAKAVMAFEAGLGKQRDESGKTAVCQAVQEICSTQPYLFSAATSCVCNGQWDYANTANVTSVSPSARTGDHKRRLVGEEDRGARKLQGTDPWQGSIGDYCDTWSGAPDGEWCFVSSHQGCDQATPQPYKTTSGVMLMRSSGPCTDAVESRSQFILDGLGAMLWALRVSAVLGALLIATAFCGALLYQSPSKPTQWVKKEARAPETKGERPGADAPPQPERIDDLQQREQLFEEAQRDAVQKLSDDTPDDLKFMLYGFYHQAKWGDVQGERPGFLNGRERSKYDYWARHRGMPREQAIDAYVRTVKLLE